MTVYSAKRRIRKEKEAYVLADDDGPELVSSEVLPDFVDLVGVDVVQKDEDDLLVVANLVVHPGDGLDLSLVSSLAFS